MDGRMHRSPGRRVRVEGDIVIARPVEEVFDFVADERNEPRYNPRMQVAEKLTPGPIGAGTRFHSVMAGTGVVAPMTVEYTAYDRPHRLASHTALRSMDIDGELLFESLDGGTRTRMRWLWELRPHGMVRLLRPLVRRVGQRQEREVWTGLKRLLETPPT